jgi:hypothetical protein
MKRATLIVWEGDDRLASLLRPWAVQQRWLLRQPRSEEELLSQGASAHLGAVVLRFGRDLEREFALLARLSTALPDLAIVVVLPEPDETLAGLAWDLGACEVLPLFRCRETLVPLIARLFPTSEAAHVPPA